MKQNSILDSRGLWTSLYTEKEIKGSRAITGHFDMLAWHSLDEDVEAIIDLKTGHSIGAGWLQVGGYISTIGLIGIGNETKLAIDYGGILHVPRVKIDKEPKGTLEIRDGAQLVKEWDIWKNRITAVYYGALATRSPGLHCQRCSDTRCPVRT